MGYAAPTNRPGMEYPVEPDVPVSLLNAALDYLLRQPALTLEQALALGDISRAKERLTMEPAQRPAETTEALEAT